MSIIKDSPKRKPFKLRAQDIEILLADDFNYRQNIIVPNVHWGMQLLYEADMVVLRKSGYAIEIEIKVSNQDIKADLQKRHHHDSNLFRELWFAVPEKIENNLNIPERAGIVSMKWHDYGGKYSPVRIRGAKINKNATKWTENQRQNLMRLGCMRTWTLKRHLQRERLKLKRMKEEN